MATRSASLAQAAKAGRSLPAERPEGDPGPELDVLDRRHVVARGHRRQARVLMALAALCVGGPLVLAALGHALVASDQVRSDTVQSQIAQALQTEQDYQLQRAELVSPARIYEIATTRLHMITPAGITYLLPVDPGMSVATAHDPYRTAASSRSRSTTATHAAP
ncbi:MAG: hypothetical protein ABSE47_02585 [Acidimicrobiales bacterium]|jgi:hypothetical protein